MDTQIQHGYLMLARLIAQPRASAPALLSAASAV